MSDESVEYEFIRVEHEQDLTWIVLDRPEQANALSNELLDEFTHALEELRTTGGPVIAIRGEGRGFSSGYDLGQVGVPKAADPVGDWERLQRNVNRFVAIWDHPKPVIAAVHGYCIAGATQLCVFADITIVAEDSKIGEPTVPIGGGYIAPLWAPLVGAKRAKELAFVPGNWIDGPTAVEWGWANHSVPGDKLIERVRDLAGRIALVPADILRIKKLSINRAMESTGVRAASAAVAELDSLLHTSPSVLGLRDQMRDQGLKSVIAQYRVASTMNLSGEANAQ